MHSRVLFHIGDLPQDTRGAASTVLVWPTSTPPGLWYFQGVTYDPLNITAPLEVSNVFAMTVF